MLRRSADWIVMSNSVDALRNANPALHAKRPNVSVRAPMPSKWMDSVRAQVSPGMRSAFAEAKLLDGQDVTVLSSFCATIPNQVSQKPAF
jgi:hypothetical protein